MKSSVRLTVAVAAVAGLALAACGSSKNSSTTNPVGATTVAAASGDLASTSIIVGSANFPEAVLLGEIYAQALEAKGAKITRKLNLGNRETYFAAMKSGDLQLIPEYTNSLLSFILKAKNATPTATTSRSRSRNSPPTCPTTSPS
jgi:osmoprotectant transport system substrate-binding protein